MSAGLSRSSLAAAAITLLVVALATPASAALTSVGLGFEHASPFVDGEAPYYVVEVNDAAFEGVGTLEALNGDTWEVIDEYDVIDGIGYSLLPLGPVEAPGESAQVRAVVGGVTSPETTLTVVPMELSVDTHGSVKPGYTTDISIESNAGWYGASADVYRRVGNGAWTLFKRDVELVDGDATVVFEPKRAATYYVEIDDELDEWAVAESEDLAIDVRRSVAEFSPDHQPWGFAAGSTVRVDFDKGGFGTTLTVALQYEYRDVHNNLKWKTQSTHTTVDGHTAFAWKPTRSFEYRFKVTTPSGWTSYVAGPLISRLVTTTISGPSMAWQGDSVTLTARTTGWRRHSGWYSVHYEDANGNNGMAVTDGVAAIDGKATFTVKPKRGRVFIVTYHEDDLSGETGGKWLFPAQKTFTIRTLKLAAPVYDGNPSSQRLDVTLSPAATGSATLYQRTPSGSSWQKVKSISLTAGKGSTRVAPSTTRVYQVRYGSGESNEVRVAAVG